MLMDEVLPDSDSLTEFVSWLAEILESFDHEVGGPPTLGELLEIFGESVQSEIGNPVKFKVKLRGCRYVESESRVFGLNDAVYVSASSAFAALMDDETETYESTSYAVLTSRLTFALKASGATFADARAEEIERISAPSVKRVPKSKIGSIIAIPMKNGQYRIAVVITRNRFGTALGFFRGKFAVQRLGSIQSGVFRAPIYTGDDLIAQGVWRVVGHDPGLLDLFPRDPEIYHRPDESDDELGEFGAAETSNGRLRKIGAEEADLMGLRDGSYDQVHLPEYLQSLLDEEFRGID